MTLNNDFGQFLLFVSDYQQMDGKIKTWILPFPTRENPNMGRHSSITQSCCSMT